MHNVIKKLLRFSGIGLCVVLLVTFGFIKGKVRAQVRSDQRAKYSIDSRPVEEVQVQKTPDRFTQTTAHLQTKFVKDLMSKEDSSRYIPFLNIIFDCLVKEQDLKNTHYVFYHTTVNEYRLAQDVYNRLYARKYPNKKIEDFLFLRFTNFEQQSPKSFLLNELKEYGIVNNYRGDLGALLLSANLSLFGNLDWLSSSTWDYFLKNDNKHRAPMREDYEKMMTEFGLTHKYIDELLALTKIYDSNQNTLLQIFIPQDKVDDIGYLASSLGMPKHEKSLAWVEKHIKKTEGMDIGKGADREKALLKLAEQFEKNQEHPVFKDLIKGVERGDFSLKAFLKVYRNTPWAIEGMDHVQARLLFTPNGLLNPASDIQFYRYSTASKEQLQEYNRRLDSIMNKIFAEKGGANGLPTKK